ncbi:MAG: hypothetical protein WC554_15920 [Clostridia bacterium]
MRAGTFNINEYLDKLYEANESDEKEEKETSETDEKETSESDEKEEKKSASSSSKSSSPKQSTPVSKGSSPSSPKGITNTDTVDQEGIILPEENKKFYNWLKSEYQKGKTEVKVEMKLGDSKFEPGYEMQTQPDTVNDFKPGMFGAVKTTDTKGSKTIGVSHPNTNNQVTGLSKPAEEGTGQGKELQKSKAMTVKSEPTKPVTSGKPEKAEVGKKPATPVAAKPEPEEKDAEIEKIDIKTKKDKNAK